MDELYRHWSLADSRSHSFDRTVAYIADGKNAGNVGLEQEGVSVECPSFGALAVPYKVGTGQNKSSFVSLNYIRQPIGSRQRSNKNEHRAACEPFYLIYFRAHHRDLAS